MLVEGREIGPWERRRPQRGSAVPGVRRRLPSALPKRSPKTRSATPGERTAARTRAAMIRLSRRIVVARVASRRRRRRRASRPVARMISPSPRAVQRATPVDVPVSLGLSSVSYGLFLCGEMERGAESVDLRAANRRSSLRQTDASVTNRPTLAQTRTLDLAVLALASW